MSWSRVVHLSMLVFELYYTLRPSTLKRANYVQADVILVIFQITASFLRFIRLFCPAFYIVHIFLVLGRLRGREAKMLSILCLCCGENHRTFSRQCVHHGISKWGI
jgi:hypothetical protein